MREALTAFMAAMALRSMQGTCLAGHRVAGQTQVVFHADLGGFTDVLGLPPISSVRPAAAMEQETPTSPWQPTSAPEMDAFIL
jgi:hypothetical protein